MKAINTLEAIKFIVSNGGSDYYSNLLVNQNTINYKDEIGDIKHLFKIWLDEFQWSTEEKTFMNNYIAQQKKIFHQLREILNNFKNRRNKK
ncbi:MULTISPECIES: hypothetical protein [unclassified Clostridium]|uniref:hypothetical protein n=1 Tax=unclassified Clostridium TaxID=2614128 RepID=UPI0025BBB89B|nr:MULTISPECIES: hypothetical protein [unclassified Clostridium]